ncbi:LuxR family transcriptional regulator [Paraburkholderia acidicola]|uniref:LuxR family transcriptional regulator n=1 Tax=Paraburkholderia acidicola TaxID=1912599 RepID=A0ABV1LTG1_9BURK
MKARDGVEQTFVMLDYCPIGLGVAPPGRGATPRSAIADELSDARTPAQRSLLIRTLLGAIGFDWLCYWRLNCVSDTITRAWYVRDYTAPGWPERYIDQRYLEVDPRIAFACRREWPLIWDLATLSATQPARDDTPHTTRSDETATRLKSLLSDAHEAGLRSGITFSLASPSSPQQSVLSLSCANLSRHWISDRIVGQAYALGLALHEYLIDYAGPLIARGEPSPHKSISKIQRHILDALVRGLSDRQIAESLHMSTHNVDYHLRLLKKRCGAANRVHLAYLAGQGELR